MTARNNPQQRQGEEQSTGRRMSDFLPDFPLGPFYPLAQNVYADVTNKIAYAVKTRIVMGRLYYRLSP